MGGYYCGLCSVLAADASSHKKVCRWEALVKQRDDALLQIGELRAKIIDLEGDFTTENARAVDAERLNGELQKKLRAAQEIINRHIVDCIEGLHCVDCVAEQDEACGCPMVAPIFEVMKGYCAHPYIEAVGEGFRRCKQCGEMEPPYKDQQTERPVCETCHHATHNTKCRADSNGITCGCEAQNIEKRICTGKLDCQITGHYHPQDPDLDEQT